jgi:hypothetical protein
MRRLMVVGLLAVVTGCIPAWLIPERARPETGRTIGSTARGHEPAPSLDRKRVSSKDPPQRVFAADGSSCVVTPERFREIEIGDAVLCVWTLTDR